MTISDAVYRIFRYMDVYIMYAKDSEINAVYVLYSIIWSYLWDQIWDTWDEIFSF